MDASESARLAALHDLGLLDTPAEERFDRVVRLARRMFDVPIVTVELIDGDHLFTKSAIGVPSGVNSPREGAFSPWTIRTGRPMVVQDASLDRRFAASPAVTGDQHLRFYAAVPLTAPGGQVVGVLCLASDQPRAMPAGDLALLEDLAGWVETELTADADAAQARDIQRQLLPRTAPDMPGYDVAGRCKPARHVGGDYFDWHLLDETMLQLTLADVMGKGLGAAVIAASIRAALRVTSRFNTLTEAVRRTATSMEEDFADTGRFTTLFTARLRPQHGHLEYVDAGHGLAMIVSAAGDAQQLASRDLPLGADPEGTWQSHETRLERGDTLIVVSDGLLDIYPDPDDVIKAAQGLAASDRTSDEMVDRILEASIGQALDDDLTALVVRREP